MASSLAIFFYVSKGCAVVPLESHGPHVSSGLLDFLTWGHTICGERRSIKTNTQNKLGEGWWVTAGFSGYSAGIKRKDSIIKESTRTECDHVPAIVLVLCMRAAWGDGQEHEFTAWVPGFSSELAANSLGDLRQVAERPCAFNSPSIKWGLTVFYLCNVCKVCGTESLSCQVLSSQYFPPFSLYYSHYFTIIIHPCTYLLFKGIVKLLKK